MRDALTTIKLRQAFFDFREEDQLLNRVIDRRIRRQSANHFNHAIPSNAICHSF